MLNSECATSYNACDEAAMLSWLDQDLRANRAACTLAMWHRPVLTIGPHNRDANGTDSAEAFARSLLVPAGKA